MAVLIDGKAVAAELRAQLRQATQQLWEQRGIRPGLALLLVGDHPASLVYVRSKPRACQEVGFHSVIEHLPAEATQQQVLDYIARWNADPGNPRDSGAVAAPAPHRRAGSALRY
jgi:methylenetetrahydrofolate dehydrogenase (NADP+)/methenyltetrahydrofolate cyclohydrolase